MLQSQFSLTWDLFKSNLCNGFSSLQQNEEFVDMTLAADGHFVKVHQMMVALASPYLKQLITSASCQHPIIFLNNVSQKVLCLLLEYIYKGEAIVPVESFPDFVRAAKALHIKGLESIEEDKVAESIQQLESDMCPVNVPLIMTNTANYDINENTENNKTLADSSSKNFKVAVDPEYEINTSHEHTNYSEEDYLETIDDTDMHDSVDEVETKSQTVSKKEKIPYKVKSSGLQFTVSIRGSLQVILNRFIYNLYSVKQSGIRRWRCVNYKDIKCSAYITTKDNVVVSRTHLHNHAFHDKKILSKIQKKAVFSAIEDVESRKKDILDQ